MPGSSKPDKGTTTPTDTPEAIVPVGPIADTPALAERRPTISINAKLHKALKRHAATLEVTMGEALDQIVKGHLEQHDPGALQPRVGRPPKK